MQLPDGTQKARFVFPEPPFELKGPLTVPFDLEAPKPKPQAEKKKAPPADKQPR